MTLFNSDIFVGDRKSLTKTGVLNFPMNTSHVTTARAEKQDLYVHLSYFNFIVTFLIIDWWKEFCLFTY